MPLPSSSSEHSPVNESAEDPISTLTPSSSTQYEMAHSPSIMSFTSESLPSIPSLYKTTELCPTNSEATKSISSEDFITLAKASTKVESVSDYITAPVCDSEPTQTSPSTTVDICPMEVYTKYDDADHVTPPEPSQEVIQVIATQPVEELVMQAVDEEVQAQAVPEPVPIVLPPLVEEPVQVVPPPPVEVVPSQPTASPERYPELPVTMMDPEFPPYT
ncbi:hypothetical protein EI94DRAFT_1803789 [Lactarius quietus]|nr:hypothetical protein EI94DRAFT_1803789 [Lactarius quietus]